MLISCLGLEWQNRKARPVTYAMYKGSKNSMFVSRNMIISGLVILSFLVLHFYDFWVPEMDYKYIKSLPEDPNRYYEELIEKFENPFHDDELVIHVDYGVGIYKGLELLKTNSSEEEYIQIEYLENEILYGLKGKVSENTDFTISLGEASISREGKDATLVTYSIMLQKSLEAANHLKNNFELDVEVIDLQSLRPLDTNSKKFILKKS